MPHSPFSFLPFTSIADRWEGKRFNSPNDLVISSKGTVFFTDPPYGLEGLNDSPAKELAFNGVYRLDKDGSVQLVDEGLSFPNGIALSPDGNTLYVAGGTNDGDVLRAYQREASRLSKQVEFDTDLHGGIADFVDPDLSPERLLAELTDLIGVDAELVLRVVIDGYTQAEAGKEIGLTEPAARKRFQRALKRLRDHAEQKS